MKQFRISLLLFAGIFAGCTQLPDVDPDRAARLKQQPYPEFIPLDEIPTAKPVDRVAIERDIQTRLARVNSRARGVRGSVLTTSERARLQSRRPVVRGQVLSAADRARLGTVIR